jgi:hypothetical protein
MIGLAKAAPDGSVIVSDVIEGSPGAKIVIAAFCATFAGLAGSAAGS